MPTKKNKMEHLSGSGECLKHCAKSFLPLPVRFVRFCYFSFPKRKTL